MKVIKQITIATALITTSFFGLNMAFGNSDANTQSNPKVQIDFNTRFNNIEAKNKAIAFKKQLEQVDNPERFRLECEKNNIANSCSVYAGYLDLIKGDLKQSYNYSKKAFDLGRKKSGYFIGYLQINFPELFYDDERLSIDESIDYLEQAFKAGSDDSIGILMMVYYNPEFNHVDYQKVEYYSKIAIEKNIKNSRFLLASLYVHNIKDESKIDTSIQLFKENLLLERNLVSAMALANIYLYPKKFGSKQDYVKGLAYSYITQDLRKENPYKEIPKVENKIINVMEKDFPPEVIKQAQDLYQQIKAEMDKKTIQ